MFGLSTFAQAPFASLGGTRYDVDVAESAVLSDVYASNAAFVGLLVDSIALTDDVPNQFNYYLTNAEAFNLDAEGAGAWNTYAANDENIALTTEELGAWTFYTNTDESFNLSEVV